MNFINKKKNPFEVLGIRDGEMSLSKVENAYKSMRKNLDDQISQGNFKISLTYDELEKAFQELVSYIDESANIDPEEVVISASLLPKSHKSSTNIRNNENLTANYLEENKIIYMYKEKENTERKNIRENVSRPIDSLMNMKNSSKRVKAVSSNKPELITELENIIASSENISGNLLKNLRERMSVSLEEMSNKIKVSRIYLEAIESDSFDKLPAEVYAKGFFNSYLNYIGLDRKDLVEALMEIYRARKRLIKKR